MDNFNIEELKSNQAFLEGVKNLEQEVESNFSLAKAYQLLDIYLTLGERGEKINKLFMNIVQESFRQAAEKIDKGEKIDLSNPEEWAMARGIYEFGIQEFSENNKSKAVEVFLALHFLINDFEISDAMMVHAAAIESGYSFDDFFNKLAKIEESNFNDPKAVFTTNFVQPADILLQMFKDSVERLKERLERMRNAQKREG